MFLLCHGSGSGEFQLLGDITNDMEPNSQEGDRGRKEHCQRDPYGRGSGKRHLQPNDGLIGVPANHIPRNRNPMPSGAPVATAMMVGITQSSLVFGS
jgi:hypothetical protein